MPTGTLPESGKKLWEKVYDDSKENGDSEEVAARKAWAAVKNAGWSKDSEGKWHKKSITEMSLTIKRAWLDPKTNEMRWRADASNIKDDKASDNMTLELYQSFLNRIESGELVPEEYRSEYWSGGMPYLSISHYPDLDGKAVPGVVDAVYVDGSYFKAKGRFSDTKLGNACWKSVCDDLERIKKGEAFDDKIRVSIAFLDYKHVHKSTGYEFVRESIDDICPECLLEIIKGERLGRSFFDGHLIHLAMTRVPMANELSEFEPDMEVERSMTTRKEDALSIVTDEELIDEIDAESKMIGKSEALIVKKEDEKEDEDEEMDEEEETDRKKDKKTSKSEVVEEEVGIDLTPVLSQINELKSLLTPQKPEFHILDDAIAQLKADFDYVVGAEADSDTKLQMIQEPFNALGQKIIEAMKSKVEVPAEVEPENDLVKALSQALQPLYEKLDMALAAKSVDNKNPDVPQRRSIHPSLAAKSDASLTNNNGKISIGDFAKRSVR